MIHYTVLLQVWEGILLTQDIAFRVLKVCNIHDMPHFYGTVPADLSNCVGCSNYTTILAIALWEKSALSQCSFSCISSEVIQSKTNLIYFFSGHRHVCGLFGSPCCAVRVCTERIQHCHVKMNLIVIGFDVSLDMMLPFYLWIRK